MLEILYFFLGAVGIGFVSGLLGLGGGVILTPGLILFAGLTIQQAVGISLISVISTSMSASTVYLRKGLVDIEFAIRLALSASAGSVTGGLLSEYIPGAYLAFLFSGILLYSSISILSRSNSEEVHRSLVSTSKIIFFIALAFFAGTLTGLLGLGGGIIYVPLLFLGLSFPMSRAVGTSAFTVGLTATAAAVVYYAQGALDETLEIIPAVVLGMITGAKLGGLVGAKSKSIYSRLLFAALLIYFCYRMIRQGIAQL